MMRKSPAERVLPTLSVLGLLAFWQFIVYARGIAPIYLPAPSAIAISLWQMLADGSLPMNLGLTLVRILSGFVIAAVAGIALGLVMGLSRVVAAIADPWIAALYPLPKIALIPLLIIWVGTGETYKIVISAVSAFFPIVMSTYAGARQVDRGLIQTARDLGASASQIQAKIVVPASIPHIFTGLHLGMGVTIILVIAAEMVGGSSNTGMGFLLINAGQIMDTDRVFASLVVMAVAGAAIVKFQYWLDRKIAPWALVADRA